MKQIQDILQFNKFAKNKMKTLNKMSTFIKITV